jgi:hypothetical protein
VARDASSPSSSPEVTVPGTVKFQTSLAFVFLLKLDLAERVQVF